MRKVFILMFYDDYFYVFIGEVVLTSGEQVGEVGLGAPEARVPLAIVARQHVLLARQPPLLIQAVVLLQEP